MPGVQSIYMSEHTRSYSLPLWVPDKNKYAPCFYFSHALNHSPSPPPPPPEKNTFIALLQFCALFIYIQFLKVKFDLQCE